MATTTAYIYCRSCMVIHTQTRATVIVDGRPYCSRCCQRAVTDSMGSWNPGCPPLDAPPLEVKAPKPKATPKGTKERKLFKG